MIPASGCYDGGYDELEETVTDDLSDDVCRLVGLGLLFDAQYSSESNSQSNILIFTKPCEEE